DVEALGQAAHRDALQAVLVDEGQRLLHDAVEGEPRWAALCGARRVRRLHRRSMQGRRPVAQAPSSRPRGPVYETLSADAWRQRPPCSRSAMTCATSPGARALMTRPRMASTANPRSRTIAAIAAVMFGGRRRPSPSAIASVSR